MSLQVALSPLLQPRLESNDNWKNSGYSLFGNLSWREICSCGSSKYLLVYSMSETVGRAREARPRRDVAVRMGHVPWSTV